MEKIQLTEEKLKQIIENATRRVLDEIDYRTAWSAYHKIQKQLKDPKISNAQKILLSRKADYIYSIANKKQYTQNNWKDDNDYYRVKSYVEKSGDPDFDEEEYINRYGALPTNTEINRYIRTSDNFKNFSKGVQTYKDGKWQNDPNKMKW